MQKYWAVFFGVVLLATFLIWFIAPFYGWWVPDVVSTYGPSVDNLFYVILGFTAFFFVLTEVILVYAMWKFTYDPVRRSTYTHGNHLLEMVWTAVPAGILLFIAFAQIGAWANIKYQASMPSPDVSIALMARQWEWRMRYTEDNKRFQFTEESKKADAYRAARSWAENPEIDDIHVANEIHCWKGANVKVYLRTQDVLHSFTMPNLRIKQDTLPGKTIAMWFQAVRANTTWDDEKKALRPPADKADSWEIACQELCGGRHYAMRGKLWVHDTKESYEKWLKHTREQQASRTPEKTAALGR